MESSKKKSILHIFAFVAPIAISIPLGFFLVKKKKVEKNEKIDVRFDQIESLQRQQMKLQIRLDSLIFEVNSIDKELKKIKNTKKTIDKSNIETNKKNVSKRKP